MSATADHTGFSIEPAGLDDDRLDPRVARSRASIIDAATEILVESGARAVTVDAVCERSGVAKSTMYRHWSSRAELLVAVVRCNMPELRGELPDGGFETVLRDFMQQLATSMSDPEWARIMPAVVTLKSTMPEVAELSRSDHESKLAALQPLLDRGIAEGALPDGTRAHDAIPLLIGPLFFAVLADQGHDLHQLADATATQFVAVNRH